MKLIAVLTRLEDWKDNEEIVSKVQALSKPMLGRGENGEKLGKIAIWHGNKIMVTGTAEELSEITGLSKSTIFGRARNKNTDGKKRRFEFLEGEE